MSFRSQDIRRPVRTLYSCCVKLDNTGTTTENQLTDGNGSYVFTIPANTLKADSVLEYTILSSMTNNSNSKTLRLKIGGVTISNVNATLNQSNNKIGMLHNRTIDTQVSFATASVIGIGSATSSPAATFSINFAVDQTITVTAQNANIADTLSIEALIIKVY